MKKYLISSLITLCLFMGMSINAASDRYIVEQYLTELSQETLNAMFGKGNFIARVQVQMTDSEYAVKYTQESNPKTSSSKKKSKEVYILPGVPALKNLAPDALNQLPYDSVTTMVAPKIKRMSVYILGNRDYPKSQARKAETVIKEVLKFKNGRDVFKIDYKPFYDDPLELAQKMTLIPGPEKVLTFQNLFNLLILIILCGMTLLYVIFQRQLIQKTGKEGGSGGPSINVNPNLELPEGMTGSGQESKISLDMQKIKKYFDFVTNENIDDFIFLINQQSLKVEYISLIASFLPSHLSAKLIKSLPSQQQSLVAIDLIDQKLGSKGLLEKLEKKLKSDIECFVGGKMRFSKIFDNISSDDKREIIGLVEESNPTGFKKLRPYVLLFDDLLLLEDEEMGKLISEINLEELAIALVGVNQNIKAHILNSLTKSAKDIVSQYLELKSNETPKKDIERSQDKIIALVKNMDQQGLINISEKIENI